MKHLTAKRRLARLAKAVAITCPVPEESPYAIIQEPERTTVIHVPTGGRLCINATPEEMAITGPRKDLPRGE
jgi:hypothetical protein